MSVPPLIEPLAVAKLVGDAVRNRSFYGGGDGAVDRFVKPILEILPEWPWSPGSTRSLPLVEALLDRIDAFGRSSTLTNALAASLAAHELAGSKRGRLEFEWLSLILDCCRTRRIDQFESSLEYQGCDYEPDEPLVNNLLWRGLPAVIGGPEKSLKTLISIELAAAVATGTPFLGRDVLHSQPHNVFAFSLEMPVDVWSALFLKAVESRGCEVSAAFKRLRVTGQNDLLRKGGRDRFQQYLRDTRARLVILDPLYLIAPAAEISNISKQGQMLRKLVSPIVEANATPVIIHHTTRDVQTGSAPTLRSLSGSAVAAFARSWLLLNRETEYQGGNVHELRALAGTRGYHQAMRLTFNESDWILDVRKPGNLLPDSSPATPQGASSSFLKFPARHGSKANPKG